MLKNKIMPEWTSDMVHFLAVNGDHASMKALLERLDDAEEEQKRQYDLPSELAIFIDAPMRNPGRDFVVKLAQEICSTLNFALMKTLAFALIQVGCKNSEVLAHCESKDKLRNLLVLKAIIRGYFG